MSQARPAVLAAKLFMTADVLSGGRVIAGVGTGWMREEFEALGTPPYEHSSRYPASSLGFLSFLSFVLATAAQLCITRRLAC